MNVPFYFFDSGICHVNKRNIESQLGSFPYSRSHSRSGAWERSFTLDMGHLEQRTRSFYRPKYAMRFFTKKNVICFVNVNIAKNVRCMLYLARSGMLVWYGNVLWYGMVV